MNMLYSITFLFTIVLIALTSNAFADSSNIPWKITIKTNPGANSTSFWPQEIHVRQNETVQWINNDTIPHMVISGVPEHLNYSGTIFNSTIINPGETYSIKIPSHGWTAYYYFDKIHPWMTGKLDVGTAYLGTSPDFNIETDKVVYSQGEIIRISGIINNTNQITPVTIQIFDSQRNLVFQDKTKILQDFSYIYELKATDSIFKTDGSYKIKSYYGFPSTITDVNILFNHTLPLQHNNHIPHFIKNNAKWWTDGEITDNEFTNGIQFLIKNGYMKIQVLDSSKINTHMMPIWIKNNIKNWTTNNVLDDEFASDISYMISHNIIQA